MSDPAVIAGSRHRLTSQAVQGGYAVRVLAGHITWMLGDNEWGRPVWRERAVPPDGKTFQTAFETCHYRGEDYYDKRDQRINI